MPQMNITNNDVTLVIKYILMLYVLLPPTLVSLSYFDRTWFWQLENEFA